MYSKAYTMDKYTELYLQFEFFKYLKSMAYFQKSTYNYALFGNEKVDSNFKNVEFSV